MILQENNSMISKKQLIEAEKEHWQSIISDVMAWAKANVPDIYNYSSRASYWQAALSAGIIDRDLYDYARKYYRDLWDYTGD